MKREVCGECLSRTAVRQCFARDGCEQQEGTIEKCRCQSEFMCDRPHITCCLTAYIEKLLHDDSSLRHGSVVELLIH